MIYFINLKKFSIDWFKYCLPPLKPTVEGKECLTVIQKIFSLLCSKSEKGYVDFLEFTTYFSVESLLNLSSTIKRG